MDWIIAGMRYLRPRLQTCAILEAQLQNPAGAVYDS